jgi:hypothetical protein
MNEDNPVSSSKFPLTKREICMILSGFNIKYKKKSKLDEL